MRTIRARGWAMWLVVLVSLSMSQVLVRASGGTEVTEGAPASTQGAFITRPATAWREVWNAEGTLYAAASPASDPEHVLWAVGDEGRLMRTRDGGHYWRFSRVPGRPTLRALVLWDENQGMAAGEQGALYITTDGGDTWTQRPAPSQEDFYTLDVEGDTIWLGGKEGLFISHDRGNTWKRLLTVPVRAWARGEGLWVVGTEDGRVLVRTGEEGPWVERQVDTRAVHDIAACTRSGHTTWYMAGADGLLARADTPGGPWTAFTLPRPYALFALTCEPDGDAWAAGMGGYVYQITGDQVLLHQANKEMRTLYAILSPKKGDLWVVGDGPDILRRETPDDLWVMQNGGRLVNLYEVDFVNDRVGWAVGERARFNQGRCNGIVLHTEDGGESWAVQPLTPDQDTYCDAHPAEANYGWLWGLDCVDENHCWTAGRYGRIFYTEDGGRTWQRLPSGTSKWLHEVAFPSLQRGYVGGNYDPARGHSVFLRTRDGGQSWEDMAPPIGLPLYAVDAYDEMHVAAASDQGAIIVSHNGGASWYRTNAPHRINLRAITWLDEENLWAAGAYGYLIHSVDGGRTWLYKEGGGGTHARDWWGIEFTPDRKVGFMVGGLCPRHDNLGQCYPEHTGYTGGLIAITFNGGRYWVYYTTHTPRTLRDVRVLDRNHAWAVGDAGTILLYRGEPSRTFVLKTSQAPRVDGYPGDWTVANALVLNSANADGVWGARPNGDEDISARFRVWWDERGLYMLARGLDDEPAVGDALTIAFDMDADGQPDPEDTRLHVSVPITGTHILVSESSGVAYAIRRDDRGWWFEAGYPASFFRGSWGHDRRIGWTVKLRDVDGGQETVLIRDGRQVTPNPEFGALILLDNEVRLQSGANDYTDSVDAWISNEWDKRSTNWWNGRTLHITAGDYRDVLVRFQIPMLPRGVTVEQAQLELFTTEEHGGSGPLSVGAYPLRRDWLFDQVTGLEAMRGVPWGKPGANDPELDRWAEPTDVVDVDAPDAWFTWDITPAVRDWVENPEHNYGLILKSFQPGYNPRYTFTSEAHPVAPYEDKHPILRVRYRVPVPETWTTYVPFVRY
ncbi:MAG: DNRLRE domain-containing protein [Chloroflexi bacterium]|nr:DNRLRE domain-containing protein [Chloroflexota bacterium]